jgi:hypothetical protein
MLFQEYPVNLIYEIRFVMENRVKTYTDRQQVRTSVSGLIFEATIQLREKYSKHHGEDRLLEATTDHEVRL